MTDGVGLAEVDDRHQGVGVWCVVLVFYSITHLATAVSRYPFAAHAAASSYP